MSDQEKPVGFARGGSSSVPAAGESGAAETANLDRPITLTEAQRLIQDAVNQSLRQSQSLTDKSEARIRKDIQDKLNQIDQARKTFEAAGVTITPEINEKIRRQVIDDGLLGESASETRGQPGRANPETQGAAVNDPISQAALTMMQEAGVTVLDTDPEAGTLDYTSPRSFLRSLDQAIEAKRARTTAQPGQTIPGAPAAGANRAPTNLGGTAQRTGLMEQYQAEMQKATNQPQHVRLEIRRKYRRLGLTV